MFLDFWVEPMKTKTATDNTLTFTRMITKLFPENVWSDKGTKFKGGFKQFCDSNKNVELYSTYSETKSAFAQWNIRSFKNINFEHLENKWSFHYINKLHDFLDIFIS